MFSVVDIIGNNSSTFYNYRTGESVSVVPRYLAISLAAVVGSAFFGKHFTDLYAAVISTQAILVGFSFNVLVYLASVDPLHANDTEILEDRAKVRKLNRLADEIPFNLSYFNLIALLSISAALLLTLGGAWSFDLNHLLEWMPVGYRPQAKAIAICISDGLRLCMIWVTYATLLESFATFMRLTKRVTYFFTEKRKLG